MGTPVEGVSRVAGSVDSLVGMRVDPNGRQEFSSSLNYETVAASQTDQVLGVTGAIGDEIEGVLVVPATTSPGIAQIKDGNGTAITIFTGGASSVGSLIPFYIPLCMKSTAGAWKVTTGANVSAIATGRFTT